MAQDRYSGDQVVLGGWEGRVGLLFLPGQSAASLRSAVGMPGSPVRSATQEASRGHVSTWRSSRVAIWNLLSPVRIPTLHVHGV